MDCIVPKAENGEREYNYLPTMVPSFSSFIEQKSDYAETSAPVPTYDAKGNFFGQKDLKRAKISIFENRKLVSS